MVTAAVFVNGIVGVSSACDRLRPAHPPPATQQREAEAMDVDRQAWRASPWPLSGGRRAAFALACPALALSAGSQVEAGWENRGILDGAALLDIHTTTTTTTTACAVLAVPFGCVRPLFITTESITTRPCCDGITPLPDCLLQLSPAIRHTQQRSALCGRATLPSFSHVSGRKHSTTPPSLTLLCIPTQSRLRAPASRCLSACLFLASELPAPESATAAAPPPPTTDDDRRPTTDDRCSLPVNASPRLAASLPRHTTSLPPTTPHLSLHHSHCIRSSRTASTPAHTPRCRLLRTSLPACLLLAANFCARACLSTPLQAQTSTASPETSSAQPESSRSAEAAAAASSGKQALGVPGQESSATGLSGATAHDTSDNVETGSKRSLTGRRRDASTGSKRSNRQVAGDGEKQTGTGSAERGQVDPETRPKKRGGFLSFLSCCGGSDENQDLGSRESTQPTKAATSASQPTKAKPPQQRQETQPHNASATNTSADGSKEVFDDEKTGQQPNHSEQSAAVPILPTPPADSDKPSQVVQPDTPVPSIPPGVTTVQPNPEVRPLEAERQDLQPENPTTGPPHIDTTQRNVVHPNHSTNPEVSVIAPTPIVSQQGDDAEDAIIQDRTPEQAARDTDIEMTDAGPSLPLATSDVPQSPEVETTTRERRGSSSSSSRIDLPPPPPLAERQIHNQHTDAGAVAGAGIFAAGAGVAAGQASHEASAVSTPEPAQKWLLPPITSQFSGKKCLVLDLDETLVHSSFKILHQADFTIPVEIEGQYHNVYVIKRPGVDAFLKRVGEIYEVVVFTASVSKYGDPLLDQLDISGSVHHRLFRESCYNHQGNYVKDLSQVGRPLGETIIIDNSPTSYIFHPQHAVPISSWFSDAHDNELMDLIPVLEDLATTQVRDVSLVLDVAL
ncbi:hypothetical protein Q7P37_007738 [Cladosporium fusiforme]